MWPLGQMHECARAGVGRAGRPPGPLRRTHAPRISRRPRAGAHLSTAWIEVHRELVVDKSLSDAPGSTCLGSSKLHLVVLVHLCVGHAQIVICLSRQRKSSQQRRLQRGYVPILDVTHVRHSLESLQPRCIRIGWAMNQRLGRLRTPGCHEIKDSLQCSSKGRQERIMLNPQSELKTTSSQRDESCSKAVSAPFSVPASALVSCLGSGFCVASDGTLWVRPQARF